MSKKLVIGVVVALVGIAGIVIAQQSYPDLEDPTVVLQNDHVVVQKFSPKTGAWSGVHTHVGNQLVIILEDSTMMYKVGGEEEKVEHKAGDVFWVDEVEHDHMAKTEGSAILVTVK